VFKHADAGIPRFFLSGPRGAGARRVSVFSCNDRARRGAGERCTASNSSRNTAVSRKAVGGWPAARLCRAEERTGSGLERYAATPSTCLRARTRDRVAEVAPSPEHRRAVGPPGRPPQRSADGCPPAALRARPPKRIAPTAARNPPAALHARVDRRNAAKRSRPGHAVRAASWSCSSRHITLPEPDFGSASTKSTSFGTL
jgi:hypothetical protein